MKKIGMKTIESERLILRKFTIEDTEQMYNNWASDALTCRYLTWDVHKNKEVTKGFINFTISNYTDPYFFSWVVERKDDSILIGSISVVDLSVRDSFCEIGYCYGSKFWNQGYATEALRAVIEFLFTDVDVELIEANHVSTNPASGKVMLKAGMEYEATLRSRRIDKVTGIRVDQLKYSILKEEYNTNKFN